MTATYIWFLHSFCLSSSSLCLYGHVGMFVIVINASSPYVRKDFCMMVCSNHFHMFSMVDLHIKSSDDDHDKTYLKIFVPACKEDQK